MRRTISFALAAALLFAGCGKPAARVETDAYAGLEDAIKLWRTDIEKQPGCGAKPADGLACRAFLVNCKGEAAPDPKETQVTVKVVAGMSWDAWNPKRQDYDPAAGGASFAKIGGKWVRTAISGPFNQATCIAG